MLNSKNSMTRIIILHDKKKQVKKIVILRERGNQYSGCEENQGPEEC